MKVMKLALIGTAALAAASVTARADDLADLKAQIEALNGRISQLEAAPAVPAGYQLLSVSKQDAIVVPGLDMDKGFGKTATTVGIMPTADVPASTVIQWSGYARAALVYSKTKWNYTAGLAKDVAAGVLPVTSDDLDVLARGQLKVVGTTDTAVGEVGAQVQLRGNYDGHGDAGVIMNEAWGWWKMTPELTLGGGYTGSLANIGYGYDAACNCYYTDNAPVALNPGDATQMRLSYASGPLSFALALEDATQTVAYAEPWLNAKGVTNTAVVAADGLGVTGEIKYSGDAFSAEVSGGWWDTSGTPLAPAAGLGKIVATDTTTDAYQIGAGVGFGLGDMASISMAAGMGRQATGDKYWKGSILASANLSDAVHAEIAYGHTNWGSSAGSAGGMIQYKGKTDAVLAGIYYDPVSQLTIGLEGEWYRTTYKGLATGGAGGLAVTESAKQTTTQVDLVTVFRF